MKIASMHVQCTIHRNGITVKSPLVLSTSEQSCHQWIHNIHYSPGLLTAQSQQSGIAGVQNENIYLDWCCKCIYCIKA